MSRRANAKDIWQMGWPLVCLAATPSLHVFLRAHLKPAVAGLAVVGWLLVMARQEAIAAVGLGAARAQGSRAKAIFYVGNATIQRISIVLVVPYALAAVMLRQPAFVIAPLLLGAFWISCLKALGDDAKAQLVDISLRAWLRKVLGKPAPQNPYPPGDPRREMWEAVQVLGAKERKKRKYQTERITRSFRPLELDDKSSMAEALAALPETKDKRLRVTGQNEETFQVKAVKGDAKRQLDRAVGDLHARNLKEGIDEQRHYYGMLERAETGEVDRTYEVKKDEALPDLRPDQVPEGIEKPEEERVWEVREE